MEREEERSSLTYRQKALKYLFIPSNQLRPWTHSNRSSYFHLCNTTFIFIPAVHYHFFFTFIFQSRPPPYFTCIICRTTTTPLFLCNVWFTITSILGMGPYVRWSLFVFVVQRRPRCNTLGLFRPNRMSQSTLPPPPLPISSLESLKFKATQLHESILALQRTIEYGGVDAMPSWPDVLSKYNVLLSQTLNLSVGLVGSTSATPMAAGAGIGGAIEGNQYTVSHYTPTSL